MSTWICPRCQQELSLYNAYCEYCKNEEIVYNPCKYFIREIRISHICEDGDKPMTPQEELFSQLFNHEKILVKDMDTLTLRAHREELAKIVFEARARLSAADDEENVRKPKKTDKGFQRNLNIDETTSNAINTINDRQKRLTRNEKILEGLKKLGIDPKEAERIMSSGAILERIKEKGVKINIEETIEKISVFNPFEKKES